MDANLFDQTPLATDVLFDDDPRAVLARAIDTGAGVIWGVAPDRLGDPTPCDEYTVRDLLEHLVGVLRHLAALGRGGQMPAHLGPVPEVADDGWLEAWLEAADELRAAWRDDATLTQVIRLPWAEMSGAATLVAYTMEITVHTWDLAEATGQTVRWDEDVVGVALDAVREHLPVAPRGGAVPFGEVVAVAPDAPPIEHLVAWAGRRP